MATLEFPRDLGYASPAVIRGVTADIFQQSQRTVASHGVLVQRLRRGVYEPSVAAGGEEAFFEVFSNLALRPLALARGQAAGDRVIAFVAAFVKDVLNVALETDKAESSNSGAGAGDDQEELQEGEGPNYARAERLLERLLEKVRPGIMARNRNVRCRACQLTLALLQSSELLSDEEIGRVRATALSRSHDRDRFVRQQAALLLAVIFEPAQSDCPTEESQDVDNIQVRRRLIALATLDSSPEVRRAALLNLPAQRENYELLVSRARDTNAINRRFVYSRVIPSLGDFRKLKLGHREQLLDWGLQDRDRSVVEAATTLLAKNWLRAVENDLVALLQRLDVLNSNVAERALFAFFDLRPDVVEQRMLFPAEFWSQISQETAFLVRCFGQYCYGHNREQLAEERLPVLSELVEHISVGWEKCQSVESDAPEYSEHEFVVEQLLLLAGVYDSGDEVGRRALVTLMRNMLIAERSPSEIVVRQIMRIQRKYAVSDSDFVLTAIELIDDMRDSLEAAADKEARSENEDENLDVMMICLIVAEEALRLVEKPLKDASRVEALLEQYVMPALRSLHPEIGLRGVRLLGLASLASSVVSTKIGVPLLLSSGEALLDDPPFEQFEERCIIVQSLCDIALTHGINGESDSERVLRHQEQLLVDPFDPQVCAAAAQSLAKILLAELTTSERIVAALVRSYFLPQHAEGAQLLRQALSFFFPVYCQSKPQNQKRVALVSVPVFLDIYEELISRPNLKLSPVSVLAQLVDWTDPKKRLDTFVSMDPENPHLAIAHALLAALPSIGDAESQRLVRAITSTLLKLELGTNCTELVALQEALAECPKPAERLAYAAFSKFEAKVADLKEKNQLNAAGIPQNVLAGLSGA